MNRTIRACVFAGALGAVAPAAAVDIDVLLAPDGFGGTLMTINGAGEDHNGTANGAANSSQWSNLVGGNPFAAALGTTTFNLSAPLAFADGVSVDAIALEHDGAPHSDNQDDFWLIFSDLFDADDAFSIVGTRTVTGLSHDLLTPGFYTAENAIGVLNLTIAVVPAPPALGLLLVPVALLGCRRAA